MNPVEYMFEVRLNTDETHSPRSIEITGIRQRISTSNLSEQEMEGSA